MAKHDYKRFILYSGDELGLILTYARQYIKQCNCTNKIKLFGLGVNMKELLLYLCASLFLTLLSLMLVFIIKI